VTPTVWNALTEAQNVQSATKVATYKAILA